MPEPAAVLDSLATAVADDEWVDWARAESKSLPQGDLDIVRQLKTISAISAARRTETTPEARRARPAFVAAYTALLGTAGFKLVLGVLGAHVALTGPTGVGWAFPINVLVFGATGALLLLAGTKDPRVRSLGALFVIIASAFVNPLLPSTGVLGAIARVVRHMPIDAFVGVTLWLFVRTFPRVPHRSGARRVADAFLVTSLVIGVVLFVANMLLGRNAFASGPAAVRILLHALDRQAPALAYWPLVFGVTLPAIPYLVWRSRHETVDDRRRVAFFVTALAIGLTPMFVVVIASPFVPALADPSRRRAIGLVLYVALLSIVPSTVYAVLVQRIMDLHLIARRTMQHALARYTVWLVSLGPPIYLLIDVYLYRDLKVTEFFNGGTPIALLALSIGSVSALTFRSQLLRTVDRWFLRDSADYIESLARLEHGLRGTRSIREVAAVLTAEIERAIRPHKLAVLIVEEEGNQLAPMAGSVRPLAGTSALVELLRSVRTEVQLHGHDGPIARLLPRADREWLVEGGVHALFPLVGATDTLLGVVALGDSRSELAYTAQDRMLVTAMSGQVAMRLENLRFREWPVDGSNSGSSFQAPMVDWQNEPAAYCPQCLTVCRPETLCCSCRTRLQPAALPLVVKGKFRVERWLGSGGMGVVYLAVDMTLDRRVAIKTLPTMSANRSVQLRREAKAMASVLHPNLALIFGAEDWGDTPLIIFEYLEGGTLADRVRQGPLEIDEALELGLILADVLDRVHGSGVLHRDIKPSNIGYTGDGVPKLLDFGLAAILDRTEGAEAPSFGRTAGATLAADLLERWQPSTTITINQQIVGTPLYLAPEALHGEAPQPSFDLWALNLTIYEAIAGRHPLSDGTAADVLDRIQRDTIEDVREFRPGCPASVAEFFLAALSLDAARRPPTAAEVRDRLQWLRYGPDRRAI